MDSYEIIYNVLNHQFMFRFVVTNGFIRNRQNEPKYNNGLAAKKENEASRHCTLKKLTRTNSVHCFIYFRALCQENKLSARAISISINIIDELQKLVI